MFQNARCYSGDANFDKSKFEEAEAGPTTIPDDEERDNNWISKIQKLLIECFVYFSETVG